MGTDTLTVLPQVIPTLIIFFLEEEEKGPEPRKSQRHS